MTSNEPTQATQATQATEPTEATQWARTKSDAESFVERWSQIWNGPDSDPQLYMSLLHPGALLTNPVNPITREELPEFMESVLGLVPDMRVVPIQWTEIADGVFIEWRNTGTLHGERFEIQGVDLYYLRDGKGYAGVSYFDPRPLFQDPPNPATDDR